MGLGILIGYSILATVFIIGVALFPCISKCKTRLKNVLLWAYLLIIISICIIVSGTSLVGDVVSFRSAAMAVNYNRPYDNVAEVVRGEDSALILNYLQLEPTNARTYGVVILPMTSSGRFHPQQDKMKYNSVLVDGFNISVRYVEGRKGYYLLIEHTESLPDGNCYIFDSEGSVFTRHLYRLDSDIKVFDMVYFSELPENYSFTHDGRPIDLAQCVWHER